MSDTNLKAAWTSKDTYASVLLAMFLDRFGTEGLEWDPTTITLEIEKEFDIDLPQLAFDKLMAGIQILTTDKFYSSLPDFINFCNILSGTTYRPDMWDPADAEEIAWGITEAILIYPPEDDIEEPFNEEIRAYIGGVLDSEGLINPPDILRIALRTARVSPSITDFSDDPTMFNAIYDLEEGKRQDIEQSIRQQTKTLAAQFHALNLKNGNTDQIVKILNKAAN